MNCCTRAFISSKETSSFPAYCKKSKSVFVKPIHFPKQAFDTVAGNGMLEVAFGGTHHKLYGRQRRRNLYFIPAPFYPKKTYTQTRRGRKMFSLRKKTGNKPLFVESFVFGQGRHSLYFWALPRLFFLPAITARAAALLAATLFSSFFDAGLVRVCALDVPDFFLLLAGSGA